MDKGSNFEPIGAAPKRARRFPVKLLTGYWPLDGGEKMPEGSEAALPTDEAKDLVKRGLAVRNDPL